MQSGPKLTCTDNLQSDIEELIKKATAFIAACYCVKQMPEEVMSDIWFQVRLSKTGKKKIMCTAEIDFFASYTRVL